MTAKSFAPSQLVLDADQAQELLTRADALQEEASRVVCDLRLLEHLGQHGEVVQLGSSISGLMTWRDIDFSIYTTPAEFGRFLADAAPNSHSG